MPLNRIRRVVAAQRGDFAPAFRSLTAIAVSMVAFELVARDYPIVFVTADNGASCAVFAVLGPAAQSKLFPMADQAWVGAAASRPTFGAVHPA